VVRRLFISKSTRRTSYDETLSIVVRSGSIEAVRAHSRHSGPWIPGGLRAQASVVVAEASQILRACRSVQRLAHYPRTAGATWGRRRALALAVGAVGECGLPRSRAHMVRSPRPPRISSSARRSSEQPRAQIRVAKRGRAAWPPREDSQAARRPEFCTRQTPRSSRLLAAVYAT